MISVKLLNYKMLCKLLLLLILFLWSREFLICSHHPYQLHSIIISYDLRKFFNENSNNSITFWDCLSDDKWPPHLLVDKESKFHKISPILPRKTLWDFSRKEECNSIVKKRQMYFQVSDHKGKNFLNLNSDNNYPIYPSYSKGGT